MKLNLINKIHKIVLHDFTEWKDVNIHVFCVVDTIFIRTPSCQFFHRNFVKTFFCKCHRNWLVLCNKIATNAISSISVIYKDVAKDPTFISPIRIKISQNLVRHQMPYHCHFHLRIKLLFRLQNAWSNVTFSYLSSTDWCILCNSTTSTMLLEAILDIGKL